MISRFHVLLCAALLLLLWVVDHPCFATDDLSPEKFLQEYREAVKQYETVNSTIQIEGTLSVSKFRKVKGSEGKVDVHIKYLSSNGQERLIRGDKKEDNQKDFGRAVDVLGSDRNFTLVRSSPEEAYRIQELISDSKARRSKLVNPFLGYTVDSPYTLGGIPILPMIESKDFDFIKIETINNKDNLRVRLEFVYDLSNSGRPGKRRGWMIFDPKNKWVVCEYDYKTTFNKIPDFMASFSGMNRYKIEGDRVPLPEEVTGTMTTFQSGKEVTRDEYHFQAERLSTDPIPDSEFTLAAYGLGDVEQPPGAPTNTLPYWAFGFAAVALGISVVLKRMARQA